MDRAEAVKILEKQLDVTSVNTPSCIELHEAIDLAIEALGQPESEDCISRQQAIEALTGWETEPLDEDIVRTLNNLPPVTPPKKVVAQVSIDTEELIERIKEEYKITDKVGEWIDTEFLKLKECSCCHCRWGMYDVENFDYCPTCGAKMGRKDGEA